MATLKGILQSLWGEVRPAVEARRPDLCRELARMVNRGKAAEALAQWASVLEGPPHREEEVLRRLARRYGVELPLPGARSLQDLRRQFWAECVQRPVPTLLNCRLLFDDPLPDRIWLHRSGAWILYRFDGARFPGMPLSQARARAEEGCADPAELMLVVPMDGELHPNPKLPNPA